MTMAAIPAILYYKLRILFIMNCVGVILGLVLPSSVSFSKLSAF